jgi:1,4-dihydroxy-2-naphthoyl-CoA hydrolase
MIWKSKITPEILNKRNKNTMSDHLGIVFIEVKDNSVIAKMPVDKRTLQPNHILNGGASCALAETVASSAANYCIDQNKICVGQSIFTTHIKPIKNGFVFAKAFPIHLGRRTQIWQIDIFDIDQKLISKTQLTLLVVDKIF